MSRMRSESSETGFLPSQDFSQRILLLGGTLPDTGVLRNRIPPRDFFPKDSAPKAGYFPIQESSETGFLPSQDSSQRIPL